MSAPEVSPDRIVNELCDEYGIEPHEVLDFVQRDHSIVMAFDSLVAEHRPPTDLPATLATVDDVRRVCEAAGLTEQDYAATETSRTWTTADGSVRIRAWFDDLDFYCTSPVDLPFGVDMFRGTPSLVLWHAIRAARSTS